MKYLLVLLATLSLAACGGGGSSSESSAPVTAVYSGTQTITFSAAGVAPETTVVAFQMTTRSDGSVFITDLADPALTANGSVSGSNFTASGSVPVTEAGLSCTFNVAYSGAISGGGVSGSLSGNAPCSASGQSITIGISGSFTASTTSKALIDGGSVVKAALEIAQ